MEAHSAIGERILAKVDDYAEIAKIVRHHHERVDGRDTRMASPATKFRCFHGSSPWRMPITR